MLYQHLLLLLWPFLFLLGTRCAAVTPIPNKTTATVRESHQFHVNAAVPAQQQRGKWSSREHDLEPPITTPTCVCRLTTHTSNGSRNSTNRADDRHIPCSIVPPASTTAQSSSWATAWNRSAEQSTATAGRVLHFLLVQNNGPASASRVLAPTVLANATTATGTILHVPTPQARWPGLHRSVASSLPRRQTSDHTTGAFFGQDLSNTHNHGRQMSNVDLGPNNDLGPGPIASTDARPTSILADDSVSRAGMDAIVSAIGDGAAAAVTTRPGQPTAANALSVLLSALPSDVRSSMVSQFEATQTFSTSTRPTSTSTRPTASSTTQITTPSARSSTHTHASSTSSSIPAATTTAAPPVDSQQISNGTIAGVATGVVAGAVLIILGIILLIRRRRQGQAPFGPRGSQRSKGSGRAYPEVAWLYDPAPTPPNEPSPHREESDASLLPRAPEMTAAGGASPHLRPVGPDSPLLPPHMPFAPGASPVTSPNSSRNSSPRSAGRRSGRSSINSSDPRRPLHIISEETHAQ